MWVSDQLLVCCWIVSVSSFKWCSTSRTIRNSHSQRCSSSYLICTIVYHRSVCAMMHVIYDNLQLYMSCFCCRAIHSLRTYVNLHIQTLANYLQFQFYNPSTIALKSISKTTVCELVYTLIVSSMLDPNSV